MASTRDYLPFERLPEWTDADVEYFIAHDQVHGPQMKVLREANQIAHQSGYAGAALCGLLFLARSRSILGAGAGAFVGFFGGFEVGHGYTTMTTTRNINTREVQNAFLKHWRHYHGIPQPEPIKFPKHVVSNLLGFAKSQ
eukprot:TRINITY_DN478_c0_g1_i1.p1 TRINITY_DN478_c0_g1~~TRINITY_DN478_c0_g1_i1.p1  ORF type:complete len:140 (+),score=30.69 TRINITY_DN478_c0_g1_i1:88-507(+)